MAARSPEAIARKRERERVTERARIRHRKVEIHAECESWFTLTCSRCFRLFDVPRSGQRLRTICDECRR